MKRFLIFVYCASFIGLLSLVAGAQIPPIPTSRPAALDRLETLIGVWDIDATCRFSPDGDLFHGKGVERVYWSRDRHFLISDQWILLPAGWLPKIAITSWDPSKREYRMTNVLPNATYVTVMNFEKDVIASIDERNDGGHSTRTWTTTEVLSAEKRRFRTECSIDNGPKWLFSEGTSVLREAPPAKTDPKTSSK